MYQTEKKWTKINSTYSIWEEILIGVAQGSFLGPLLFNTFLWDLFWIMSETDLANYEDDNTLYVSEDSTDYVNKWFEDNSINLLKWFLEMQI